MKVNPDVVVCKKTRKHREIKNKKLQTSEDHRLKTKAILNIKM